MHLQKWFSMESCLMWRSFHFFESNKFWDFLSTKCVCLLVKVLLKYQLSFFMYNQTWIEFFFPIHFLEWSGIEFSHVCFLNDTRWLLHVFEGSFFKTHMLCSLHIYIPSMIWLFLHYQCNIIRYMHFCNNVKLIVIIILVSFPNLVSFIMCLDFFIVTTLSSWSRLGHEKKWRLG